jgi:hypothetical protein
MKCLIPVLAMIIFMIQIHAIFIMAPPDNNTDKDNYSDYQSKDALVNTLNNDTIIQDNLKSDDGYFSLSIQENQSSNISILTPNLISSISYLNDSHSIYISEENYFKKNNDKKDEEDCIDYLINCLSKCGFAFLAGALLSEMKFIKFGVI